MYVHVFPTDVYLCSKRNFGSELGISLQPNGDDMPSALGWMLREPHDDKLLI